MKGLGSRRGARTRSKLYSYNRLTKGYKNGQDNPKKKLDIKKDEISKLVKSKEVKAAFDDIMNSNLNEDGDDKSS